MRLLNTKTLELVDFVENRVPLYAILSHRWGPDEVSFQELESGHADRKKAGYQKIEKTCSIAASHGFEYAWVDTCCIDKTSSAELSEAINSMYRWYQNSVVCYAHLVDVALPPGHSPGQVPPDFSKSQWFTRGWTLQELIAPTTFLFFDSEWREIGFKTDQALCLAISNRTGISGTILKGLEAVESASIAERMHWASTRETTRTEDMAYCLMGLFSVNMPMLYGEGGKAFARLQEEIIKTSDDYTTFAWFPTSGRESGLLADSPRDFALSFGVTPKSYPSRDQSGGRGRTISADNTGIHLTLRIFRQSNKAGNYTAVLPCGPRGSSEYCAMYLRISPRVQGSFIRVWSDSDSMVELSGPRDLDSVCPEARACILHVRPPAKSALTIFRAVEYGNSNVLTLLLRSVHSLEAREESTNATPLIWGARLGHDNVIRDLIERGADIEATESNGRTALMAAAMYNYPEAVRILLEKGADIEAADSIGYTALIHASYLGSRNAAEVLIEMGANMEARCGPDTNIQTPLGVAAQNGRVDVARLLIDKGVSLDVAHNLHGDTPVFLAALMSQHETATLLVERGANLRAVSRARRAAVAPYIFIPGGSELYRQLLG